MKKHIITLLFLLFFVPWANAAPVPPNCVCEITAKVISVKEVPIQKNEFIKDLVSVDMEIEIIEVGPMIKKGYAPEMTCSQYKPGQEIKIHVIKEGNFVDKNAMIKPGMLLKGHIQYAGDENGSWYVFDNIQEAKIEGIDK